MNNMRSIVFVASAVAVLCVAVRVLIPDHQAVPQATPKPARVHRQAESIQPTPMTRSVEPRVAIPATRQRPLSEERLAPSVSDPQAEPVKPETQAEAGTQKATQAPPNTKESAPAKAKTPKVAGARQGVPPVKEPIQDPMARAALAFVGADLEAELYWYEAINDPSLSAQERQDLIEDLNEDGLFDPHHPTLDDLPLILSRIELIEEVVWDAMDEVNADAFLEAYKDLVNLAFQAMETG